MLTKSFKKNKFTGKVVSKNQVEWTIPKKPIQKFKIKVVSKNQVEWTIPKKPIKKFTGKVFSKNQVEWNLKKKKFEGFLKFLKKLKSSKSPLTYIYRLYKYQFFKEINKQFPQSSSFLINFLKKYPNNIKFIYLPGTLYLSPFLMYHKFMLTEKILFELSLRGIPTNKIIQNEKVSMSILSKFTVILNLESFSKSKRFITYLNNIEKELNKNI
jgi:hypothetical protein